MNKHKTKFYQNSKIWSILLIIMLVGCTQSPESCPSQPFADLSLVDSLAGIDLLPFRFPLVNVGNDTQLSYTEFCSRSSWTTSEHKYHAAEDFLRPAGTPVYAMAEGSISYSGPMAGYGLLIIIDHPQANLYSLYGHLSPSRWHKKSGLVKKGELISYLGDSHENGGSKDNPLIPHLHLGVRAGQRANYSGMGEWRWQAGWIKPCPKNLGWMQPSEIITGQTIPSGGFPNPVTGFLEIWWIELLFATIYIIGGMCIIVLAIKKNKSFLLVLSSGVLFVAWWYFHIKSTRMSYAIFAMASILLAIWAYKCIHRFVKKTQN